MNHPAAKVQCIPPAQRQRHTSASSSQGLIEIQPETTKAPCRTKCYQFWAQKPHVKSRVGVWTWSLKLKTKSWLLTFGPSQFFHCKWPTKMCCSFACLLCPMASVLNSAVCPVPPVELSFSRVSRSALFYKYNKCISYLSNINNLTMYFSE